MYRPCCATITTTSTSTAAATSISDSTRSSSSNTLGCVKICHGLCSVSDMQLVPFPVQCLSVQPYAKSAVGTMSEEQRCNRKCGYLLWCSCGPGLPPRCIYPVAQKHHCRCFLCCKQIRASQGVSRARSVGPAVSPPAPTTQHIDKYRAESQICKRNVWPESTSLSHALMSIHNMIIPNTMQYVGCGNRLGPCLQAPQDPRR